LIWKVVRGGRRREVEGRKGGGRREEEGGRRGPGEIITLVTLPA
jgi:hypothetical protein